jgi:hypothetical protein
LPVDAGQWFLHQIAGRLGREGAQLLTLECASRLLPFYARVGGRDSGLPSAPAWLPAKPGSAELARVRLRFVVLPPVAPSSSSASVYYRNVASSLSTLRQVRRRLRCWQRAATAQARSELAAIRPTDQVAAVASGRESSFAAGSPWR